MKNWVFRRFLLAIISQSFHKILSNILVSLHCFYIFFKGQELDVWRQSVAESNELHTKITMKTNRDCFCFMVLGIILTLSKYSQTTDELTRYQPKHFKALSGDHLEYKFLPIIHYFRLKFQIRLTFEWFSVVCPDPETSTHQSESRKILQPTGIKEMIIFFLKSDWSVLFTINAILVTGGGHRFS